MVHEHRMVITEWNELTKNIAVAETMDCFKWRLDKHTDEEGRWMRKKDGCSLLLLLCIFVHCPRAQGSCDTQVLSVYLLQESLGTHFINQTEMDGQTAGWTVH